MMSSDIIFKITLEDIQQQSNEKLGRNLTEDEIEVTRKKLEWGLLTGIDIVFDAIFEEMK